MTRRSHHKELVATATRQMRRRGRDQLAMRLFGVVVPAEIAAELERVAGAGIHGNEQRNEALRGAAELLDELSALLRQSACVNG